MDEEQHPRLLPKRSSRGVRPPPTQQQKHNDDQIYGQLFGSLQNQESSSDQSFSQQTGLKPLQFLFSQNFSTYNYGRGYHYFFDLNEFKRVEGSPSYAYDDQNKFKHTFSKEQQAIGNSTVGELINRKLIGLPIVDKDQEKRKSKDKNICHGELFSIQDKKYYNSRLLQKYKTILKHIEKLTSSKKIIQFTQFKKDHFVPQIIDLNISIQSKKELLMGKIKVIEQRMQNMSPFWQRQDQMYFRYSLNQIFHNKIDEFASSLTQMSIIYKLVQRVDALEVFKNKQVNPQVEIAKIIKNSFKYQGQKYISISQQMQNRIISIGNQHHKNYNSEGVFRINSPLFIFYFGQANMMQQIDHVIASKTYAEDHGIFYAFKSTLRKVFSRELPQKMLQNNLLMEDYTQQIYKAIDDIQYFFKHQPTQKDKFPPSLDQSIAEDQFKYSHSIFLLNPTSKTAINAKDFLVIYIYSKICKAFQEFSRYIKQNDKILELMTNKNYQKYHHGISQILLSEQFASLNQLILKLHYIIKNPNPFPQINLQLFFWMNQQNGVGVVWHQEENDWQTQKEESEQNQSNGQMPSKKVKLD